MAWVKEGTLKGPTGEQGPPGPTDYDSLDLRYLKLEGGTLTGPLVVNASYDHLRLMGAGQADFKFVGEDATQWASFIASPNGMQVYTDQPDSSITFGVEYQGGLVIGKTYIQANTQINMYEAPTQSYHVATKGYVDGRPSGMDQATADARYLQLSGGTLTGELVVQSSMYVEKVAGAGGHLEVQGNSTLQGRATVLDALTAESTLDVLGVATFEDSVSIFDLSVEATILAKSGLYCPNGGITVDNGNVTAKQVRATTAAPAAVNDLTRKDYVDAQVATRLTQALADTRYVNVDGDTMTALLTLTPTTSEALRINAPASPNSSVIKFRSGGSDRAEIGVSSSFLWLGYGGSTVLSVNATEVSANQPVRLPIGSSPASDYIAAHKLYVDTQRDTRVAKTGDTLTGNLKFQKSAPRIDLESVGGSTRYGSVIGGAVGLTLEGPNTTAIVLLSTDVDFNKPIYLPSDPTQALQAATKQYVDGKAGITQVAADARYLQLAGGVLTGALTVNTFLSVYDNAFFYGDTVQVTNTLEAGMLSTPVVTGLDLPVMGHHAANKDYVDSKAGITQATADARYVNVTGDETIDGFKTLTSDLQINTMIWFKDYDTPSNSALGAISFLAGEFCIGDLIGDDGLSSLSLQAPLITAYGPVALPANPAQPLHAAPKQYVDAQVATRVTLTGDDSISGFKAFTDDTEFYSDVIMHANLVLDKDVGYGDLTLASDPTSAMHAATKQYVDGKAGITQATADTRYAPLRQTLTLFGSSGYTPMTADENKLILLASATAQNVTVVPNATVPIPLGYRIDIAQIGDGQITIVSAGVTLVATPGLKLRAKGSVVSLIKTADPDTWLCTGDLTA